MKKSALFILVIFRVIIGWHFAVEGISKLLNPSWTSEGYLTMAKGAFAPLFQWIAASPTLLGIADFVTMWGLTIVGILDDHDETVAFFAEHPEIPWIAFKILAAGAIKQAVAIPYSFNKGADFLCVGMYDFQVVENANLITDILGKGFPERKRRWYA